MEASNLLQRVSLHMNKAILVNYNHTPSWLLESGLDYHLFDRSDSKEWLKDFPQERITYTKNVGNVDYDKLGYLVDNYDILPEVFLWGKSNLYKYISEEEWNEVKDNKDFTPLLTATHKTYSDQRGVVCYYDENGLYRERNDSWFLGEHAPLYVQTFNEWCQEFYLKPEQYIPFAPGGNYILTRERVHRYGRATYEKMRMMLDYAQLPGEAHCAERSYYLLWK